jgi:hypothetical protein
MNYVVYQALNTLAGANTTLTSNLSAVGAAIQAVNPNFNGTNIQGIWTQLQGALDGWYCNETHQSDGTYATTYANLALSTPVTLVQTAQWKYINANTRVSAVMATNYNGDISVHGSDKPTGE